MDKILSAQVSGGRSRRPNFPLEFKRQLVEATFEPGASVARVARQGDINANLLFKWRRLYLAGAYGSPAVSGQELAQPEGSALLLPVTVLEETPLASADVVVRESVSVPQACCEIEFDRARLHVRGEVPAATLRLLVRELSR